MERKCWFYIQLIKSTFANLYYRDKITTTPIFKLRNIQRVQAVYYARMAVTNSNVFRPETLPPQESLRDDAIKG